MSEDTNPSTPDSPEEAAPSVSPAQLAETLSAFESRIQAGEFDHGGFHRAVQHELYPLLGEGALEPAPFGRLVDMWAKRAHPFDWPARPYGRLD